MFSSFRFTITVAAILVLIAAFGCHAANDRPLIYGMNPTPMDWWGKDPYVWDPILFQKMGQAGCTSARIGVNWDVIEPVEGSRDWSGIDRWVDYCLDNNIEPLILINSTPEWALPDYVDPNVPYPWARYPPAEEYAQTFKDWCYDLVRRYRGRVRYYEFWNEANGYGWYTALTDPQSFGRADLYTPWMIRAYEGLKRADPTCMMSTTGIDDGGEGHAPGYLEDIYACGGQGYFDAVADHPYPMGGLFQGWKLSGIRNTLDAHGDNHVDVWITEFGYNWGNFTNEINYYLNALSQSIYDYTTIATWHTANEFPWEDGFGLMDDNLNPKPEYYEFQNFPKPARPVTSNVQVTNLSASSVRITYNTNIAATTLVMYGPDKNYGMITAREQTASTSHEAVLVGLSANSTYHYRVRMGAVEHGDSFSADYTFTTLNGPVVNIISGPTFSNAQDTTATISWTTNVPSTSMVDYGFDFSYGSSAGSSTPVTNHVVNLTGLQPGKNYQYRVTSAANGYADGSKEGDAFSTESAFATLINGGFEQGFSGWTYWEVYPWGTGDPDWPGHVGYGINNGIQLPTPGVVDGNNRMTGECGWVSAVGGVYQTISVDNGLYLVSGWMAANCDGGTELAEIIAVDGPYISGIPECVKIASASTTINWTHYAGAVEVTTGQLTVALRGSQWSAVDIITVHFDEISVAPLGVSAQSVSGVKEGAAGDTVVTNGQQVVSAVFDANTFYVQEENRTSGIKVVTAAPNEAVVGERVNVYGTLAIQDGEVFVDDANLMRLSTGDEPKPLAMTNLAVGGSDLGIQPGVEPSGLGINNIGLLVRTCGRVTAADSTSFTIEDGSGAGVKCAIDGANGLVSVNDYMSVTGISSCEESAGQVNRLLRVRSAGDVSVMQ